MPSERQCCDQQQGSAVDKRRRAGGQHGQEAQQWADAPIFEDAKR
jgi:hypothetical protein